MPHQSREPRDADTDSQLERKLTLPGAVFIGLGSMIGAGVFSAYGPAANAAGKYLVLSLLIAGCVALLNALSSAQLAARYPTSGGAYAFGREVLGPWWGFIAGWSFIVGKIASSSAIALTFAAFVAPPTLAKPTAILAVAIITFVNMRGITRTARMAAIIVIPVLMILSLFFAISLSIDSPPMATNMNGSLYGALQGAGIFFFAFAGYARVATLGEEVVDPHRTIKRAIFISLTIVFSLYLLMGLTLSRLLGIPDLANSVHPTLDVAEFAPSGLIRPLLVIGAALASLGSLLALIAGISRTMFAMARERDLPELLATIDRRHNAPRNAELVVGVVVIAIVTLTDLRSAIGFSSAGVLLYYFVANFAAYKQPSIERLVPRWVPLAGATLCLIVVATLPIVSLISAIAVVVIGLIYRVLFIHRHI